jgi:hypothetical protein
MSFIDVSYFIGEINIPNTDEPAIAQRLTGFINKYEPDFLQKLFGYPLYKAFVAGMTVTPPATPAQRFLNILYGTEYTDFQGRLQKWKGLIVTDSPIFTMAGNLSYKKTVYITAGITAGFVPNTNTATLDGTNGTDDWRGWTPILFRDGELIFPDVDYSWNIQTGVLTLLGAGNVFGDDEQLASQFEERTDPIDAPDVEGQESCIANYIYFRYKQNYATQTTDLGEVVTQAENSRNASPHKKMASAWNAMHYWVKEFCEFMEATANTDPTIYPEWTLPDEHHALRHFAFMNPIF